MKALFFVLVGVWMLAIRGAAGAGAGAAALPEAGLFSRTNLVAWCIVPFDTRKRGPEERGAMLERLGIRRLAYDWRNEHIPTFDAEVAAMRRRGIELTAWWFPANLGAEARAILDCLGRNRLRPQLWVTMGTETELDPVRLEQKLAGAVGTLGPICAEAAKLGCTVGLYNHLGWFGEPENQVALLARLRAGGHTNAGIVYNFHHGHAHIDQFPRLLELMKPHLLAINLNGMVWDGDRIGKKIIPLGTGDEELDLLRALWASGWKGPVGILGHTEEDAELKLTKELEGLVRLVPQLSQPPGPRKPRPRAGASGNADAPSRLGAAGEPIVDGQFGKALDARVRGLVTAGKAEVRQAPFWVEARVRIGSKANFNILVASEAKASESHWELYTYAGGGELSFYQPGAEPAEVRSGMGLADGAWHHVAACNEPGRVRLYVDGREVANQEVRRRVVAEGGAAQLAVGQLVEGGLGCDGWIESVRISRGTRLPGEAAKGALFADATTLGYWGFASLNDLDGWAALASTVPPVGATRATGAATPTPSAVAAAAARSINRDEPWKQGEGDWVDDRWNLTVPGRWQAYYLPTPTGVVRKGLAVRLGESADATVCYDTGTGQWRSAWTGGFLRFDPARFGLLGAPQMAGDVRFSLPESAGWKGAPFRWRGFAVAGDRLVLEYALGDLEVRESPWAVSRDGVTVFLRDFEFGPAFTAKPTLNLLGEAHGVPVEGGAGEWSFLGFGDGGAGRRAVWFQPTPGVSLARAADRGISLAVEPRAGPVRLRLGYVFGESSRPEAAVTVARLVTEAGKVPELGAMAAAAKAPMSEPLVVKGQLGAGADAYAIDTIPVPYENPWKALMFASGVGFFENGDAAVATIHGDVWRVSGLDARLERVEWRRIATGLYQPLGLTMADNRVIVLCRDHLTRLQDRNGDGFTDYYESWSGAIETSGGGHDYVTSLERDAAGNFYYVDPKGVHRISADGRRYETLATGFRNPNGLGVSPDGRILTVAPQQGEWTPSSVIHEIKAGGWYGYGGPRAGEGRPDGYDLPLCWIPHRVDNSSGSQVWTMSDRFGPLSDRLLHLSWGRCTMLLTLRDVVDGQAQGAVVPLKGRFLSGPMRGTMNPRDGQLYVVGCQGWQTAAARDGSFQRVRWTGKRLAVPVGWQARRGALQVTFSESLDRETVLDPGSYALEAWNYRYSRQYGSKDWSVKEPEREGRDVWTVRSARLESDGRTVVLEVPELGPAMQFGLKFNLDTADGKPAAGEMYGTLHRVR